MNFKLRLVALMLVILMCFTSCEFFGNIINSTTTPTTAVAPTTKPSATKSNTTKTTTTKVTKPALPSVEFDPYSNSTSKDELVKRYTLTQEEVDAAKAILDTMVARSLDENATMEEFDALYSEFETAFYHIAQQMTISMIVYYYKMNDEVSKERYLNTTDMFYSIQDKYNQALKEMYLNSPLKDQIFEGWSEAELESVKDYDPQIMTLKKEIDELQVQYDQLSQQDPNYDNKCVEIYKKLIVKNNALARLNKYENYYDYAAANVYDRDYKREQLADFRNYVVQYVVPNVSKVFNDYNSSSKWTSNTKKSRLDEYLFQPFYTSAKRNYLSAYLDSLGDTTMGNSMRYVFESKNCLFSYDGNSHHTAFQTYLYEDDTPFCFFGSNGQSASTVVHEIGHYYAAYNNSDLDNYDLCETHSQGNEFLFLTYCEEYMDDDVFAAARAYNLFNACYVLVMATVIDEFEQRLYVLDDATISKMTGDDFDDIMTSVCEAYGGASWVSGMLSDPYSYWRLVTISSPVYYISYAVSASAALGIYAIAEQDYDAAITAYTTLVEGVTAEDGFLGALAKAGLTTPFEEETFVNIAGVLSK